MQLELIKGFVAKVVDPRDIVKSNAEILVLRHPGTGEKSIVNSYPAASKTLRGSGGDVLWLEEAAFMPPSLFFEVVLPLLEVDKTSMLAISTPSPEGNMNFYTTMMDSKDPNTGKPMFKVLKVGLACDACQAAGIASECTHSKLGLQIYPLHFDALTSFLCPNSFQWSRSAHRGRAPAK